MKLVWILELMMVMKLANVRHAAGGRGQGANKTQPAVESGMIISRLKIIPIPYRTGCRIYPGGSMARRSNSPSGSMVHHSRTIVVPYTRQRQLCHPPCVL